MDKQSGTKRAREKATSWLLKHLGHSKTNNGRNGCKEGGLRQRFSSRWRDRKSDGNTKPKVDCGSSEKENDLDVYQTRSMPMSKPSTNHTCRQSEDSDSSEQSDHSDREHYIGRRTSIGSVERNDSTALFDILDDLRDFDDTKESMANLRRLRRHLLAKYGNSDWCRLGGEGLRMIER